MNAREKLKVASEEELENMFCSLMTASASLVDANSVCDICPVANMCSKEKSGFVAFLEQNSELNFERFVVKYRR